MDRRRSGGEPRSNTLGGAERRAPPGRTSGSVRSHSLATRSRAGSVLQMNDVENRFGDSHCFYVFEQFTVERLDHRIVGGLAKVG